MREYTRLNEFQNDSLSIAGNELIQEYNRQRVALFMLDRIAENRLLERLYSELIHNIELLTQLSKQLEVLLNDLFLLTCDQVTHKTQQQLVSVNNNFKTRYLQAGLNTHFCDPAIADCLEALTTVHSSMETQLNYYQRLMNNHNIVVNKLWNEMFFLQVLRNYKQHVDELLKQYRVLKTLIDKRNLGRIRKIRRKHIQWRKLISHN